MKRNLISTFAVALIGAMSPALFATSIVRQPDANTEPIRLHVDVDRAVLPGETVKKAITKIGLETDRIPRRDLRPPVNIALVIDRSGSMAGDKIAKAREAALEAVRRLAPDDIVALVVFDTS